MGSNQNGKITEVINSLEHRVTGDSPFFVCSEQAAENLTVTLNAGEYQIIDRNNGEQMIRMEGFGNLLGPVNLCCQQRVL